MSTLKHHILPLLLLLSTTTAACRFAPTHHPSVSPDSTAIHASSADTVPAAAPRRHYAPGDTIDSRYLEENGTAEFFAVSPLSDEIFSRINGRSYKSDCSVARSELRYVTCLHTTAEGHSIMGEMIVNQSIADTIVSILHHLYDARYPIERMRLVDLYNADDERSMTANNSSAFNFRRISHSQRISKHGLGLAIDINPLYNPHCKTLSNGNTTTAPAAGAAYADRRRNFNYKITRGDLCYRLFHQAGFTWGGDWRHSKDYQHFER